MSAIILAAGFSERMKVHKTELKFDEKRNFLQKITEEYLDFGCNSVIVVLNKINYNSLNEKKLVFSDKIKFVINENPEKGKIFSLKKGVKEIKNSDCVFLQNIDNPFVSQEILEVLKENYEKGDYIIPSYENRGGHPVLISEKVINFVKNEIDFNLNMKLFLNRFKKYYIPVNNNKISANINTRSDYDLHFKKVIK
ncbi:MAG: NTP transferase domain-containing protein [Bacteroidales bacterium]|nr:NTP transferase domain-containing protein [Bacteroidales bacterium]